MLKAQESHPRSFACVPSRYFCLSAFVFVHFLCAFVFTVDEMAGSNHCVHPTHRREPWQFFKMPTPEDGLPVWTMADVVAKGNPEYEEGANKSYYAAINSNVGVFWHFIACRAFVHACTHHPLARSLSHSLSHTCTHAHTRTHTSPHSFATPVYQVIQWLGPQGPGFRSWGLYSRNFFAKQMVFEFTKFAYDPK